jgi:hypothetical protein
MDNGLIQFLFIAIFVIVSMMDGAARKRRKEAQRLGHMPQATGIQEADDDLDEVAQASEGMVPEDLWKEISALARGDTTAPTGGHPATSDPSSIPDRSPEEDGWTTTRQELPPNRVPGMGTGERVRWSVGRPERLDAPVPMGTRLGDLQGGYEHPEQAATHEEHGVRRLREEGPHAPVLHASEASPVPTKMPSRRAGASRSLLAGVRHGAKKSLRDAIVIAEVLNPPMVLRDSEGGHLS